MTNDKKIAIATGTRADWGLLRPLADELRRREVPLRVWATNMHADPAFGNSLAEISADGYQPELIGRYRENADETVAENTAAFGKALREASPKAIIILGDRIEMLGVASAALVNGVPIIHIAGGTVSEGAVDDAIRNAISQMASLHLTETEGSAKRLLGMGIPAANIHICGALGVYNATRRKLMSREELEESLGFDLGKQLLVATLHAATRPGPGEEPLEAMRSMLQALDLWLAEDEGNRVILTWPNNDVDPAPQVREMEKLAAKKPEQVLVIPSLGALRYLSAVSLSKGVIGNSSSGLVEVPSAGVPTLDIGSRQTGRECGPSVSHCAPDAKAIYKGIRQILSPEAQTQAARRENPYARQDTPSKMAAAITSHLSHQSD